MLYERLNTIKERVGLSIKNKILNVCLKERTITHVILMIKHNKRTRKIKLSERILNAKKHEFFN